MVHEDIYHVVVHLLMYLFAPLIISSDRATGDMAIQKRIGMSRTLERYSQATDIPAELCIDKQHSGIGNKHYSRCSQNR
jgi:hypothetical protein